MRAEPTASLLERFEIERALGQGGHGVVTEAYDLRRKERVALKSLQRVGGEALYRFKREFRSLAGLSHPNLVSLYELFANGDDWYFTMELVRGIPFVEWVRGSSPSLPDDPETLDVPRVASIAPRAPPAPLPRPGDGVGTPADRAALHARLRHGARQIAEALFTLHQAGWKHGDVKPSNVLVTAEGRVVVLDFGVITELDEQSVDEVAGTPIYMAPEQVRCEAVTAASDWYSLGVMLFECLTGHRPMEGGAITLMSLKARAPRVPAAEELPEDTPADLRSLTLDLLRAAPADRPTGPEVLRRLGAVTSLAPPPAPEAASRVGVPDLVGRDPELASLRALLAEVGAGRGRAALVHGSSGMGKTELIDAFLAPLEDAGHVVLRGRCYEREAVPYKALDSFVDALVRWLRARPLAEVEGLLPDDTGALAAVFPVLKRLDAVAMRTTATPVYTAQLGRRALEALGELVTELSARHRVVAFVDDLQWGDLDSAAFLAKLVAADGPPLLFLGSFRSEFRGESALLRALFEAAPLTPGSLVELPLAPLAPEALEELAARWLRSVGAPIALAERIAVQAKGSPYFAQELARHVGDGLRRGASADDSTTLKDVVLARASRLSNEARRLLDLVAIAGSPVGREVLDAAAGGSESKYLVELTAGHFTTTRRVGDRERVDTAHDAVREALLGALPKPRERALHLAMARAIETTDVDSSAHSLAEHYFQAWPDAPAARVFALCEAAGREAAASHAYEQAYVHLARARSVAGEAALRLDLAFLRLFGVVASRAGHMDPAAEALRSALRDANVDSVQKAALHLALSRIALGRLDTTAAHDEACAGLRALGLPTPEPTALGVARALSTLVAMLGRLRVRPSTFGSRRGDAATKAGAALMKQSAQAAYFRMDRLTFLQMPMRQFVLAARLGDSPELVDSCASAALVAAAAGRRKLARRLLTRATAVADVLGSPIATVPALDYRGHVLHFLGECVEAEIVTVACLSERSQWMENVDYLTSVAHLAWNTMMRGRPEIGWRWVLRARERTAVDGPESRLTKGHTYLCYGGPLLAQLGRAREGREVLEDFRRDAGGLAAWQRISWLAHVALFLAITGDVGAELEEALRDFHAFARAPRALPLVLRHFFVGQARGRLLQLERDSGSPTAWARWRDAREQLARAAEHPTLEAHLAMLDARVLRLAGDHLAARARLSRARALATEHQNAWIASEVAAFDGA